MRGFLADMTLNEFMKDERTARAVSMTLVNIGELVKHVGADVRELSPHIAWRAIAGMRDVTAHKYQTLRKEDVYKTCVEDIEALGRQIESLLEASS